MPSRPSSVNGSTAWLSTSPLALPYEPEDFETGWFGQHGSLGRVHALFGKKLKALMAELNEWLAA